MNLDEAETRANAATPGPLEYCLFPAETHEEAIAFLSEMVKKREATEIWGVKTVVSNPDDAVQPCVTGNGPTAEDNAWFFAHAREDVLALIAEVRRLQEERRRNAMQFITDFGQYEEWAEERKRLIAEVRQLRQELKEFEMAAEAEAQFANEYRDEAAQLRQAAKEVIRIALEGVANGRNSASDWILALANLEYAINRKEPPNEHRTEAATQDA